MNFIVDYLHVFNIFLMNSWYVEGFYIRPPPPPESLRKDQVSAKILWTYELIVISSKLTKVVNTGNKKNNENVSLAMFC